jgi:hypothetical protein
MEGCLKVVARRLHCIGTRGTNGSCVRLNKELGKAARGEGSNDAKIDSAKEYFHCRWMRLLYTQTSQSRFSGFLCILISIAKGARF